MALSREAKEEIDFEIKEKDLELVSIIHPYQEDYINVLKNMKKGIIYDDGDFSHQK